MTNKQEAKNWITIAGKFAAAEAEFTCHAIHDLCPEMYGVMINRFWGNRNRDEYIPREWTVENLVGKEGRNVRALYALFMALECDPNCLD